MFTKILIVPRRKIGMYLKIQEDLTKVCVISISTPFGDMLNLSKFVNDRMFEGIKGIDDQVLHLEFDDIDVNPHGVYMPMHFRHAVEILRFFRFWHQEFDVDTERTLIIHCDAGISRSGAIGTFLSETYDIPMEALRRLDPNKHCLRELKTAERFLNTNKSPKEQREEDIAEVNSLFKGETNA